MPSHTIASDTRKIAASRTCHSGRRMCAPISTPTTTTNPSFAVDVVDAAPENRRALLEISRDGGRREWSFGVVSDRSARLAGTLTNYGVTRGDRVMTVIGNRPEWVLTMVACFRLGAVVLPCTEQLRAHDLRLRLAVALPRVIVADERNRAELDAAHPDCPVLTIPDDSLYDAPPPAPAELAP